MNSIPLIKGNTPQEINTSIIALKKALDNLQATNSEDLQKHIDEINAQIEILNAQITALQPVDTVTSGNMHPVTSNAVADKISSLDVSSVGGSGKYISAISETDGKINATATDLATSITSGGTTPPTSGAVYSAIKTKNKVTLSFNNFSVNADSVASIDISSLNIDSPYIAFIYNRSSLFGLVLTGDGYGTLLVYNTTNINFNNVKIELCFIW